MEEYAPPFAHDPSQALTPYVPAHPLHSENLENAAGLLVAREGQEVITPHVCVSCGSSQPGGEYVERKLSWAPTWTYVTLLISPLIFILSYYLARKRLPARYYLCPNCYRRVRQVRAATGVSWMLLLGGVSAAALFGAAEAMMVVSLFVFAFMSVVLLFNRAPLRITSYQQGNFVLQARHPSYAQILGVAPRRAAPLALPHHPTAAPRREQPMSHAAQPVMPQQPQPTPRQAPKPQPVAPPRHDGTDGDI